MKQNNLRIHILLPLLLLMCFTGSAFAWTATYLGGGQWAIGCANGTHWSYSGSSAGLDIVGPALCPAGVVSPKDDPSDPQLPDDLIKDVAKEVGVVTPVIGDLPKGVTKGVSPLIAKNILFNNMELTDKEPQSVKTYPPKGYPCLGCEPCPPDFCSTETSNIVFIPDSTEAIYTKGKLHFPSVLVIDGFDGKSIYKATFKLTDSKDALTFQFLSAEK